MKKNKLLLWLSLLFVIRTSAQESFRHSGKIEFEKTVNTYAVIKQQLGKNPSDLKILAFEEYKKKHPQFIKYTSSLLFNKSAALYQKDNNSDTKDRSSFDNPMIAPDNLVFNDLVKKYNLTQRNIFGEFFVIKDSVRKIDWKLTDETREIAGYLCRRANAIIMDSIYVVAFYTDKIRISSGPESFSGLPGMILGVVLPHENVNWYATTVNLDKSEEINVPKLDGRMVSKNELIDIIKEGMKYRAANLLYFLKIISI